jgi:uncharacterized membrane protein YkvA (DUF1232 family)
VEYPKQAYAQVSNVDMKPKSKAAGPIIRSIDSSTTDFGQLPADTWRLSGSTMTIDEFIENQSQDVRSADLRILCRFTGRLLDKLVETNANEYTGLQEAVQVIVHVLESPAARQAKDPLPSWLAETGFAAGYLLKRYDLMPGHLSGIGLADDVLILQRVIERNELAICRSAGHIDLTRDKNSRKDRGLD